MYQRNPVCHITYSAGSFYVLGLKLKYSKPAEWNMVCIGVEITIFLCKKAEKVSEIPSFVLWLKCLEENVI